MRVNYYSIECLLRCLEGLRLLSGSSLTEAHHSGCNGGRCKWVELRGLMKSIQTYVETLKTAIFNKRKADGDWLLVFYSLNIQIYVRRALITLERRLACRQTGLVSFDYLHDAVKNFNLVSAKSKASARSKGKLADQLLKTPSQPSIFANVPSFVNMARQQSPSPASEADTWERWREVGIEEHLRTSFQMDDEPGPRTAGPPDDRLRLLSAESLNDSPGLLSVDPTDDGPGLLPADTLGEDAYSEADSDATATPGPVAPNNRRNRESNGSSRTPRKKVQRTASSTRPATPETPSERAPTPYMSEYSKTSRGIPSIASSRLGTDNSSLLSFTTADSWSTYVPWAVEPAPAPQPPPPPANKRAVPILPARPAPAHSCTCCRTPSRFATTTDLR